MHDILSAVSGSEKASVRGGNMKERYICTLPKVVDEVDMLLLVLNAMGTTQPEPTTSWPGRKLGATRECLSMRCSISAPTMPFHSVGSHQRTILFLSTALAFSFSFIQPSVTVERRRLPNAGNEGAFRGMSTGGTYEGVTICSTRAYATDSQLSIHL
ncbi:hypothetical protein EDB85DRAFT_1894723 [Lactarius pseudohatsudake]|nr:hypothetical protein EDB85DRAFT_1894723 [Lactarius pseudohatsudake]